RHTRFKCDWSSDVCSSDLFAWIKRHLFVWQGVAQNSGGRFRISVTNEENGMPWLIDDSLRENVRKCFWSHHPAGERVNTSRPCRSEERRVGKEWTSRCRSC